jgi:hypothetical protein
VATLVVLLLLALAFGLSVGWGVGWLALLPLVALLAVAAWTVLVFTTGRSPGQAIRSRPRRTQLLGPGGPDDPEANA